MSFVKDLFNESLSINNIENELYDTYNVKRGLRNANGTGVLVGLTKICEVHGYNMSDGQKIDDEGHLYYRGVDIFDLAKLEDQRFAFEKVCFLIFFGKIPNEMEFTNFHNLIADKYALPDLFLQNHILKGISKNLMNQMQRAILSLYIFDETADDIDPLSILEKGIDILAKMPAIISYSLQAKTHIHDEDGLHIAYPKKEYSIAENILYMSRNDGKFEKIEAETLDLALIIHADHGGGNNSTFVNVVIGSTGTDIYSSLAGALGSLKGPRHGGANKEVLDMMDAVISTISIDATDDEIIAIIEKLLDKDFYNKTGLIYGIGHAVYTLSDPRAILLKEKCRELSIMKNKEKEFMFYSRFEELAIKTLKSRKKDTNFCANVDFYSGFAYGLLDIPRELFTPIFATARICGWIAHNIENKLYCNRIIRPAAKYVGEIKKEL